MPSQVLPGPTICHTNLVQGRQAILFSWSFENMLMTAFGRLPKSSPSIKTAEQDRQAPFMSR